MKIAKEFKSRMKKSIGDEWLAILPNLRSRITDKFHIKKKDKLIREWYIMKKRANRSKNTKIVFIKVF